MFLFPFILVVKCLLNLTDKEYLQRNYVCVCAVCMCVCEREF